ncbi:MAG: excinuclease ABC subunit UvrB [Patescibacteria group bacterium]
MFKLHSPYQPAGDQPKAIEQLIQGLKAGLGRQTLLGVTGSGKTFTVANVIEAVQRPTLVIAHNKTLAAQLCNEFREFFPENAVEYFVSYYDYYQPEAYLPTSDTFIEKEATINEEIDRLRHSTTQSLLSRRDVIVVATVSCIYGLGSPSSYERVMTHISTGSQSLDGQVGPNLKTLTRRLIETQFVRTTVDVNRGQYRLRGDVLEIMPMNEEVLYRLIFDDDRPKEIFQLDPVTREIKNRLTELWLYPAKHFMTSLSERERSIRTIKSELEARLLELDRCGKLLEAERLGSRTKYDLEMIQNIGFCSGIENYSRHFDGRKEGEPPFTLIDYFPKDFLTIIDESHVTLPQLGGMYAGDRSRKETLVEHGFRLPSAKDNRPLNSIEFNAKIGDRIFVSATPGEVELSSSGQVVEQIIRPTGLVDPETVVRAVSAKSDGSYLGQVRDITAEVKGRVLLSERSLITTLTKKMAEDLTDYLKNEGLKVAYLHSDIETFERVKILSDLRRGVYETVVGVNLLREGLDLPEVSLIGVLDADKEGFLRSTTSLIQIIGRAARHLNGKVILYADVMTGSLKRALAETARRREIQVKFNQAHGVTPTSISKKISDIGALLGVESADTTKKILAIELTATPGEIKVVIKQKKEEMNLAAANLLFETAAILRDEITVLELELRP